MHIDLPIHVYCAVNETSASFSSERAIAQQHNIHLNINIREDMKSIENSLEK